MSKLSLRNLARTAAAVAVAAAGACAHAQSGPVKVGLMLPYSGTFTDLGKGVTNGFKLYVQEQGGKLGGRPVEYLQVDDESDPSKANENANKLVKRDKVDVMVGTIHSGVASTMAKVARETNTLLLVPNAGAGEITGAMCSPNVFRTSFSNWQPGYASGLLAAKKHKTAVTISWKYAAGDESVKGFREGFEKGGGKVLKDLNLPFPNVEFQPLLTELATIKPEAAYVFVAGAGQVKFVKDYAAAGLKNSIPLYGAFITEGTLAAQGDAAQGLQTVLHYGDGLKNPKNDAFIAAYTKAYGARPDVFAVQGYDAAQLYDAGLKAVKGDTKKKAEMIKAMENAKIDSPRGRLTFSKSHNPVQDYYVRVAKGTENVVTDTIVKALADPSPDCKIQ
ncbi:ABC transporter substrate-binding protein [Ramlibacter albus]|uniref:ABC transporter substrate-binding protein n=1 Tax=Ramlibacter albus TaxID=2079448 RepID=A0A923M466_9BURK|nr:ABC transporter substrate-binding protein [Ramlibacter albus]MBC5763060.1 ABC transporter substrate-binding protein [Ramlibacter albus]